MGNRSIHHPDGLGAGIEASWERSRAAGLRAERPPVRSMVDIDPMSRLARAARPVLEQASVELVGLPMGLVLADRAACVVDVPHVDGQLRRSFEVFGLERGLCLSEELLGTNSVGTVVETGRGQMVCGGEHFSETFHDFACYGQPIIHPVTRRLEGVLNISGLAAADNALMVPLVRRMAGEIEQRLRSFSGRSQRLLLEAFELAARTPRRPVVVVGQGLVLATPAAVDLLDPADHAVLRTCVEEVSRGRGTIHDVELASGRKVRLRLTAVEGTDGVLVEMLPQVRPRMTTAQPATVAWPLLVVGEVGTGRTTRALEAAGSSAVIADAADVVRRGEQSWAAEVGLLLETAGPPIVIENIQLLSGALTALLVAGLRGLARQVVLTSTPGEHLEGILAPLVVACAARDDLVPLRRRRHDIPHLAQQMLAGFGGSQRRLTADTMQVLAGQPWPGNLTELHRVIGALARLRSTGDIVPADLPPTHRGTGAAGSPLRQAEREVIVAAIDAAGGNKLQAARALGMSRSTLYNRMRALKIY